MLSELRAILPAFAGALVAFSAPIGLALAPALIWGPDAFRAQPLLGCGWMLICISLCLDPAKAARRREMPIVAAAFYAAGALIAVFAAIVFHGMGYALYL